ncbi:MULTISPECIES: energy-coupling factor ABC transporter ATP-binding protein [unclassified Corynebacterium]|uniref:energy-coupling factor ABC transporter ATP-binding protein n=1 Tax=unclassified Corynebacterium TaxID=2624378 RepID=UPI0030B7C92B
MSTISFQSAEAVYNGRRILHPLTVELTEHRIGIIGANGGGKSSFARLINGLGAATGGSVFVDTLNVAKDSKSVRKKVGFIFSDADNQIVMPTVAEDVGFSLRRHKLSKAERQTRVAAVLERFGLADHADQSPHLLSGGQKQMLALASVMVLEPEIIIADEPTTLLDLRNRLHIRSVFEELSQQVIVVTHDLDFVRSYDRVLCIDSGRIVDDGNPASVIDAYVDRMTTTER